MSTKFKNEEVKLGIVESLEDLTLTGTDFIHLGIDTSPVKVVVTGSLDVTSQEDPKNIDAWLKKTATLKGIKPEEKIKLIEEGLAISYGMIADNNMLLNLTGKTIAEKAIIIGEFCINLKKLRKGNTDGILWGDFADSAIPLSIRVRQKYMLIASRPDCHEFVYLGVDKMALLCSIAKKIKGKNAIRLMMLKYKIPYDKGNNLTMDEFKQLVTAMIESEKLIKEGLNLDFEQVKNALKAKVKIDTALKKRLKDATTSGGKPAVLLEKIIDGDDGGSSDPSPEERIQDFNTLSERLIKTVSCAIESVSQPDSDDLTGQVDKEIFDVLIQELEKLENKLSGSEEE